MNITVTKRDGKKVPYDKEKIRNAVKKAFFEVYNDDIDEEWLGKKVDKVTEKVDFIIQDSLRTTCRTKARIEGIQDLVESVLMDEDKSVAKAYITYRYKQQLARDKYKDLMDAVENKLSARDIKNQNANVDEASFGGRIGETASLVMKRYALDYIMSDMARNNHLNNEIYIHDLDHYAVGSHNCLSIPFDDLLAKGFNTRQTDVRPAQSVSTAFQLVAVIFQLQSLQQFGGVSATHLDWTMVPYVRKSFFKHYCDAIRYINTENRKVINPMPDWSIDSSDYKEVDEWYQYAMNMTERETYQAVEGMYHNLNTLQSRSGNQLPFTSINYGTCTLPEGRLIIKALLEMSIKGVGKVHKTSIFPCGIFQMKKGINRKPGEPNYDLYRLALRSTAQRLYPNYANVDWSGNVGYDENDPTTYFSTIKSVA